jgi:hypothetical protein
MLWICVVATNLAETSTTKTAFVLGGNWFSMTDVGESGVNLTSAYMTKVLDPSKLPINLDFVEGITPLV